MKSINDMGGPEMASSTQKNRSSIMFSLIIFIIAGVFAFFSADQGLVLEVSHQETGEVYASVPVKAGDQVTFEWIHSFEHIPWYEYFRVEGENSLELESIKVAGFGAGIPENKGKVTVKDGMVVMTEINENFDHMQWLNSITALQFIAVNDKELLKGTDMPHHEPIELRIKRRFQLWRKPR